MEAKNLADLYDLPLVEWEQVESRLDDPRGIAGPGSGASSWLATTNSDGSPHLTGLGPLWVSGRFYFASGEKTRKSRNLAANPRCTLGVSTEHFDLSVDGEAEIVADPQVVTELAQRYASDGGWPVRPDDAGTGLTADFSAPSAGPPPWRLYRFTPRQATAVLSSEPGGATLWTF